MTQTEFETRTGLQVSASFYHDIIEVEYMKDETDKDTFCESWKEAHKMTQSKLDTVENIVRYPLSVIDERNHRLLEELKDMKNRLDEVTEQRDETIEECGRLQNELETVRRQLKMTEGDWWRARWEIVKLKVRHGEGLDDNEKLMLLDLICHNTTAPANASGGDC